MTLAVIDAKNLIYSAHIDGIDNVYTINIPKEVVENTDQTIVLLTDANTNLDIPGNNNFGALRRMIEVQIFYSLHPKRDPEEIDVALYRLFKHHNWDIGENRGHTYDPDTEQLTSTFYVSDLKLV